jgi:hypothetical protein
LSRQDQIYEAVFKFFLDTQIDTYERSFKNVLDLTGLVGGVFEIIEVVFGFIIGNYTQKMLNFSLVNRMKEESNEDNQKDLDTSFYGYEYSKFKSIYPCKRFMSDRNK